MSGRYDMPEGRTWCGILRCCREQDHKGSCEVDITELMPDELDAIRRSAKEGLDEMRETLEQLKWAVQCGEENDLRSAADDAAELLEKFLQKLQ